MPVNVVNSNKVQQPQQQLKVGDSNKLTGIVDKSANCTSRRGCNGPG